MFTEISVLIFTEISEAAAVAETCDSSYNGGVALTPPRRSVDLVSPPQYPKYSESTYLVHKRGDR